MLYRPSFEKLAGERFRVSSFVWRRPRVTAYYENLRDRTPSNECGALSLFFEVVEALSIALVPCHRSLLGSAELEKCKPRFPSVFVSRKYPSAILAGLPSTENSRNSRPLKQCACEGKMGCHHRGNAMLDFTRDTRSMKVRHCKRPNKPPHGPIDLARRRGYPRNKLAHRSIAKSLNLHVPSLLFFLTPLLEPDSADIDGHHQHFQDRAAIWSTRVGATPGGQANTVRRHII
jgi:hypothetical protein